MYIIPHSNCSVSSHASASRDVCSRDFPRSTLIDRGLKKVVMASKTRDDRVIAAVACPTCGARAGERCRNPVPHQAWRGPVDRRAQPLRPHIERRAEWVSKRTRDLVLLDVALDAKKSRI